MNALAAALALILAQPPAPVNPPATPAEPAPPSEPGERLGPPQVERPIPIQRTIPDIGPVREVRRVGWGYAHAGGMVADAEGNVYFADAREQKIHRIGVDGIVRTAMEGSGGITDLDVLPDGRFVGAIPREGRIVAFDLGTKKMETLADSFAGAKFIRLADLEVDSRGGIYVTDTGGLGTGMVGEGEPRRAVFYIAPPSADGAAAREVSLLIEDVSSPAGVYLAADEKTLWVLPAAENRLLSYPVQSPGKLGPQEKAADLKSSAGRGVRGGDGVARDARGNLYLAIPAALAVQVISPTGQTLGHFTFPDKPSNVAFGGKDFSTLYVTAQRSVYAIPLAVEGERPRFAPATAK